MIKIAILFILAVIFSILLGINIGKKKGYVSGWLSGHESANKYWEERVPKDVRDRINNEKYNRLLNLIYMSDEVFEKDLGFKLITGIGNKLQYICTMNTNNLIITYIPRQ